MLQRKLRCKNHKKKSLRRQLTLALALECILAAITTPILIIAVDGDIIALIATTILMGDIIGADPITTITDGVVEAITDMAEDAIMAAVEDIIRLLSKKVYNRGFSCA